MKASRPIDCEITRKAIQRFQIDSLLMKLNKHCALCKGKDPDCEHEIPVGTATKVLS